MVVAILKGDDLILCQVTSKSRDDEDAIDLRQSDFQQGNLSVDSFIRPSRLFTADTSIIRYKAGRLKETKIKEVDNKLWKFLRGN